MPALNYAESYSSALAQAYPYSLNFGALYSTENNARYKWVDSKTIKIPSISTTGRVDSDRDTIGVARRNYDNAWEPKVLANQRKWSTLVHPADIAETNMVATIQNITQVYNEENKFPEMDAYLISKIYADWAALGKTALTDAITAENVLTIFDTLMLAMSNKRVPPNGRILYCTYEISNVIKNAKEIMRTVSLQSGGSAISRAATSIDQVEIVPVPSELMKTAYDFTTGWKAAAGAKQINMLLIHPNAVITPVSYQFAKLDEPSAGSEGKYVYFEESFEDVFILNKKADAIQFAIATA